MGEWTNFFLDLILKLIPGDFHIIAGLQVHPKQGFHTEKPAETKRSISGNSATTMHYFINSARRNAYVLGKPVLADSQGFQKLLNENFSRMDWRKITLVLSSLMVIDYFNIKGIVAFPYKTNSPLLIDTNAVLTLSVSMQFLQIIGWWNPQRFEDG